MRHRYRSVIEITPYWHFDGSDNNSIGYLLHTLPISGMNEASPPCLTEPKWIFRSASLRSNSQLSKTNLQIIETFFTHSILRKSTLRAHFEIQYHWLRVFKRWEYNFLSLLSSIRIQIFMNLKSWIAFYRIHTAQFAQNFFHCSRTTATRHLHTEFIYLRFFCDT